jgi:L-alanine-DL-glutamate epimerase-like enolase superfamily enzyme
MAGPAHPIQVTGWRLHVLRIPLRATFHWANHVEDSIDVVFVELDASNGARGVAEMAVREKWQGETVASVLETLDAGILPRLRQADLGDAEAYAGAVSAAASSAVARALADMARADILAQSTGEPLWRFMARQTGYGEKGDPAQGSGLADFSCTITRASPDTMAREAEHLTRMVGARAFKIKTGQGYDIDAAAVAGIRAVSGPQAFLSADSNSAGPPELVGRMAVMLAGYDVRWFEDPCRLKPDADFGAVRDASCVPVLVDNACRSLAAAGAFLHLGAEGLSIKLMKTGLVESRDVAHAAALAGARVTVGICAATSLSAIYSLSFYAALPAYLRAMPCEETFFLNLPRDLLRERPQFRDGAVVLPHARPMADLVDWKAVDFFAVTQPKSR